MPSSNEPQVHGKREGEESSLSVSSSSAKRPYCAFQLSSEKGHFIEFRLRDPEPSESVPYAALARICTEWRGGTRFTLYFGNPLTMMVIIKGDNLKEMFGAIKMGKLEWMAEFSPSEHEEPTDASAPFIRSITIHTKRPEEPPEFAKRH